MLNRIRLDAIRRSESLSTRMVLESISRKISVLAPQCQQEYNSDTSRSDSLAQVVREEGWPGEVFESSRRRAILIPSAVSEIESGDFILGW